MELIFNQKQDWSSTMKTLAHTDFKKIALQNPETLAAYKSLAEEYELISDMLYACKRIRLMQENIADGMHTTTSEVLRFESLPDPSNKGE